jgi:hypothetical protein
VEILQFVNPWRAASTNLRHSGMAAQPAYPEPRRPPPQLDRSSLAATSALRCNPLGPGSPRKSAPAGMTQGVM